MEPTNTPGARPPGFSDAVGQHAASGEPGLVDQLLGFGHELLGRVHDQLSLAALETKLAGRSLAIMIAAGVMIAVLLISAWLGLLAAGILWLASLGVAPSVGLIIAIGANLVLAAMLYGLIRRQSHHLRFPATIRSLRPLPGGHEPAAKS